jgi:hypothetical protein
MWRAHVAAQSTQLVTTRPVDSAIGHVTLWTDAIMTAVPQVAADAPNARPTTTKCHSEIMAEGPKSGVITAAAPKRTTLSERNVK